ncbi:MAG: N-acetylmuramoyl-L-alanine amidase [Lachnospiraceae bacterium]|nr:N-acetylmuramoyl-L-alanine amidase [Lachnospiraceae bacterium]
MKKFILLLMFGMMAISMAACGKTRDDYDDIDHADVKATGKEKTTPKAEETPSPTPTPTPGKPYVLCLDPGHGGRWTGAMYFGRMEKDIVLDLCFEIRAYLNEHYPDIDVYLTRETDAVFSDDLGTDLRKRVEFAKEHGAQILISIHLNASDAHNLRGSMVCISKQPNINGISKELANALLAKTESLGLRNRGYETRNSGDTFDENGVPVDYYAICRHGASLNIPAVILESLFMDNESDYQLIKDEAALKKLAAAEAEGMAEFLISHFTKE